MAAENDDVMSGAVKRAGQHGTHLSGSSWNDDRHGVSTSRRLAASFMVSPDSRRHRR
jgi:hypothetical protein